MKKSVFVALGALLVAGSALASNTGFKLNYPLQRPSAQALVNWVSFPLFYFPNGNVSVTQQNSVDICNDVNDFQPGTPKVVTVQRWVTLSNAYAGQNCANTKALFNIVPGEAYALNPTAANVVVNIVGSNNDLYAPNKGGTARYTLQFGPGAAVNWVSVPYHTLADNSVQLCNQWNSQTGNKIASVQRWVTASNAYAGQNCQNTKVLFNLIPGEGYAAVPEEAGVQIAWDVY